MINLKLRSSKSILLPLALLQDSRLTLGAIGTIVLLQTLPETEGITLDELTILTSSTTEELEGYLNELASFDYLEIESD